MLQDSVQSLIKKNHDCKSRCKSTGIKGTETKNTQKKTVDKIQKIQRN